MAHRCCIELTGTLLWSTGATTTTLQLLAAGTYRHPNSGRMYINNSGKRNPASGKCASSTDSDSYRWCDGTSTLTASNFTRDIIMEHKEKQHREGYPDYSRNIYSHPITGYGMYHLATESQIREVHQHTYSISLQIIVMAHQH
jgi:hypothetical protein